MRDESRHEIVPPVPVKNNSWSENKKNKVVEDLRNVYPRAPLSNQIQALNEKKILFI